MKARVAGTILAVAAATMFVASAARAQEAKSSSSSSSEPAKVKCMGGNDCSGKSACKTATSAGPGQNSCKGTGFIMTTTAKECTDKGGKTDKM